MSVGQIEQDEAAGDPKRRELRLADGTVVIASIAVRRFASNSPHQQYGYLQFKVAGKTVTKYVGRVTAESRSESLRIGWALVRTRKLAESYGWTWVIATSE